jgi:pre-mRNA-splicing factor ATP-dependent RNA helicase DHX15/PRP43
MAKMLIVSPEFKCSNEILTIVAMLSGKHPDLFGCDESLTTYIVPNVWVRPNNQRKESDAAKALLSVPGGDHLTLMNAYNSYRESENIPFHRYLLPTLTTIHL